VSGDRIEVRGLRLLGVHGLLPEERSRPQPLEIDLDVEVDMARAAASDSLYDTADYGAVVERAAAVVAGPPHDLLESLAGAIATAALGDPRVTSVTVAVRKLRPPVPYDVASTGVRLTRSRP
jgi:dihydroneopterin aldolase